MFKRVSQYKVDEKSKTCTIEVNSHRLVKMADRKQ